MGKLSSKTTTFQVDIFLLPSFGVGQLSWEKFGEVAWLLYLPDRKLIDDI